MLTKIQKNFDINVNSIWKVIIINCGIEYIGDVDMILKPKFDEHFERMGLMKKFVAKKIGISQNQMSNICSGKSYPTAVNLFKIADILQCKVDDLYERVDEE